MSRIATPISKLSRSISSTSSVARPSNLLSNAAKTTANASKRQTKKDEAARPITTSTRPTAAVASRPVRKQPMMQGFKTSAPSRARHDATRVDFAVLPDMRAVESSAVADPYTTVRVPLLPTMRSSSVTRHAADAYDIPPARPEIVVMAAEPDRVLPAAMTEVEPMGADSADLKFAHELYAEEKPRAQQQEQGMIRDIWKGLVNDVLGPSGGKPTPAV